MNNLEKYRDDKANEEMEFGFSNPEFTPEEILAYRNTLKSYYKLGFDAAIALDLPNKFATWLKTVMYIDPTDNPLVIRVNPDIVPFKIGGKTENLYQYWLKNIFKPEL